jgi:hypothetical protein
MQCFQLRGMAVLLMSCEVSPKWIHSFNSPIPALSSCSFKKYSTAFTSWLVIDSICFDLLRIFNAEIIQHLPERGPAFGGELEKFLIGEEEKIFDLNQYTVFDQSVFRKKFTKLIYLFAVTAVDGGDCSKLVEFHF